MSALLPRTPSQVGALAELAVANALHRAGFAVFVPFFNAHCRVDVTYLNADGAARRVQCKYARLVNEAVVFYTCSHTGGVERDYVGEADEFGVFCEATNHVYLVPIEDVGSRVAYLRLAPPKNNQSRRIRWAHNYVLGPP